MKIKVILIGLSLATTAMLQSCNSCDNKKDISPTGTPPEVSNTENSLPADNDYANGDVSMSPSTSSENNTSGGSTPTITKSASSNTVSSGTSTKKPARNTTKYSAPNGTDAENHDGDYYTKNDTTPKPTGTIK